MKRNILVVVFLLTAFCSFGQNRVGIELGSGVPLFAQNVPSVSTNFTFSGNAYYLRKVARHWYVGGRTFFEQYSFNYNSTTSDLNGGVYGTGVLHKSSYLNFGPMVDLGVGRHREYLHFYFSGSVGFLLNGAQVVHNYYSTTVNPSAAYDTYTDSHIRINAAIFRFGMGIKQHFPVGKMWQLTFNEGYSFMPFGDLSKSASANEKNLHPGYVTLQFGVMHKFRDASRMHADRER